MMQVLVALVALAALVGALAFESGRRFEAMARGMQKPRKHKETR